MTPFDFEDDDELYADEEGFEDDYELTDSEEDDEMCYHCDGTGQKGKCICPRCDGSGRLDL